jgi:hypothetical protein
MFLILRNYFDLPLNVLFWLALSTFAPQLFFAIYANGLPGFTFMRKTADER